MITEEKQQDPVTYQHAVWLPCVQKVPRRPATGGVYDQHGNFISSTRLVRHLLPANQAIEDRADLEADRSVSTEVIVRQGKLEQTTKKLKGRYIFGGYFFAHYGHFLMETLARMWFFRQHPDIPVAWMIFGNRKVAEWHIELIRFMGVENEFIFLDEQTEFENLIVVEPGLILSCRFWQSQATAFDVAGHCETQQGKKVWLSRSRLNKGVVLNEQILEGILERRGWTIFHPQEHTVSDQLEMLKDAELVSGIEGSAFHTFLMIPQFKGKLVVISRVDSANFELVAEKYRHDLKRVTFQLPTIARIRSSFASEWNKWIPNLDKVLEALGETRSDAPVKLADRQLVDIVGQCLRISGGGVLFEAGAQDTSVSLMPGIKRALSVSGSFEHSTSYLVEKGVEHYDIDAATFFVCTGFATKVDTYCIRNGDLNRDNIIPAFNGMLDASHGKTCWVVEDGGAGSASRLLLVEMLEKYLNLTLARAAGTNLVVVWRECRPYALPSLRDLRLPECGQTEKPTIPTIQFQDIIKRLTQGSACNDL